MTITIAAFERSIIHDAPPATQIVDGMVAQACQLMGSSSRYVVR